MSVGGGEEILGFLISQVLYCTREVTGRQSRAVCWRGDPQRGGNQEQTEPGERGKSLAQRLFEHLRREESVEAYYEVGSRRMILTARLWPRRPCQVIADGAWGRVGVYELGVGGMRDLQASGGTMGRYGGAVALVLCALLLTALVLELTTGNMLLVLLALLAAIMMVASYAGNGPAFLAVGLAALLVALLLPPRYSPRIAAVGDLVLLGVFIATAELICMLIAAVNRCDEPNQASGFGGGKRQ